MHSKDIEKAIYVKELLQCCCIYGIEAYAYYIGEVNTYKEYGYINAVCWNGEQFAEQRTDLPCFTEITYGVKTLMDKYFDEYSYIVKNTTMTDGLSPSKSQLHCHMLRSELMSYAIPTYHIRCYEDLLTFIRFVPNAILKPVNGAHGVGVIKIKSDGNNILYKNKSSEGVFSKDIFEDIIMSFDKSKDYLLEPYINILNSEGRAVDFRVLVTLDGNCEWTNVLTYARVGSSAVASNVSGGGSVNLAEVVLREMFPESYNEKLAEINDIGIKVAKLIAGMRNGVSRLGIDICFDTDRGHPYVIEANSVPGCDIIGPWPMLLMRAKYFKYLMKNYEK